MIHRDSSVWWVGMVGGVVAAVVLHANEFPTLLANPLVKEGLMLLSVIAAVVSGKMATSPLPGDNDGVGPRP